MKFLIYDDNPKHSTELKELILQQSERAETDIASNAAEARDMLMNTHYDAAFIDIELDSGISGIDFAEEIRQLRAITALIYITAHIQYAEEIFITSPDALLLKPFSAESVKRVLGILSRKKQNSAPAAIVLGRRKPERIELDRISYVETRARYLYFYDQSFTQAYCFFDIKINQIKSKLPDYYVWCHKSFCVNMNYVGRLERFRFIMKNGSEIPISQNRYIDTKTRFLHFLEDGI